jgi:hypothetical protein
VIVYASINLKQHELLYTTHDLELVVVMLSLNLWRHYLLARSFQLKTYHKILKNLFTQRDLNSRKRRWSDFMSEYNFVILYIKGKENLVSNALIRKPLVFSLVPLKVNLREEVVGKILGYSWYLKVTSTLQSGRKVDLNY